MTQVLPDKVTPEAILEFWFPDHLERLDQDEHLQFWQSRMQGGMDQAICDTYAEVTRAAACGRLDHWAETALGRLALILVLDQFPRSLWRGTTNAFAQDIKATRLALEGIANGHYNALKWPWQQNFYLIAISHCEGPDHLDRMDRIVDLSERMVRVASPALAEQYSGAVEQSRRVRDIIQRFGRHPHRNPIYGRLSSPEEETYIAEGIFPHEREIG